MDIDILHFEQLKNEVQAQYLKNHTPSFDDISRWKGIDIIYFQEDLRKIAKGNISEKTFYTYFKNSPVNKLPRIDMLNILSVYAGYPSWNHYKKQNAFTQEDLSNYNLINYENDNNNQKILPTQENEEAEKDLAENALNQDKKPIDLQNNNIDNQYIKENNTIAKNKETSPQKKPFKQHLWLAISSILGIIALFLGLKDTLLTKKYYYSFIDADRNSKINAELQVQILKDKESPILYNAKPNEAFVYTTKSKKLTMVVSSPFYQSDTIIRNLDTAPEAENIELKRNEYAWMLYYYSKSIKDLKQKRESLERIIDNNALIYQIFDSDDYGMETMDKQRYIGLVTLPTTSLENLDVIDTQSDRKTGKINMIKFRINNDDKK